MRIASGQVDACVADGAEAVEDGPEDASTGPEVVVSKGNVELFSSFSSICDSASADSKHVETSSDVSHICNVGWGSSGIWEQGVTASSPAAITATKTCTIRFLMWRSPPFRRHFYGAKASIGHLKNRIC